METKPWAIAAVALNTGLTSLGQILYKIGSDQLVFTLAGLLGNGPLLLGFFIYIVSACILVIALKYGELSVLYPIIALSFVWVNILSTKILNEHLTLLKWVGICFIILGVSCIGFGSRNGKKKVDSENSSTVVGGK